MPASIETITDVTKMRALFEGYFSNNKIFLKTKSGNFVIKYAGFAEDKIALRIPLLKNMPPVCVIMCRIPGETIYAQIQYRSKDEDELYTFHPMKMQIIGAARTEERKALSGAKQLLFVSQTISPFIIEQTLSFESRKVDLIKSTVLNQIEQTFPFKKIYFLHEGLSDVRMKYFFDRKKEYFIPSVHKIDKKDPLQNYYHEEIYQRDYYLINRKQYISEGACAFYYQHKIPYGYIQVNHTVELQPSTFEMVKKLADITQKLFLKNNVFKPLEEKLLVSDISKNGLSVVFKERSYIRYFQEKSYVHFVLILPDQLRLPLFAVVRNISFIDNKIIKVGLELIEMDENVKVVYINFLNEMV